MAAGINDKFKKVAPNTGWQLNASGIADAVVTSFTLVSATGLPTDTAVILTVDRVDSSGTKTPSKMERIKGIVSGANVISCVRGIGGTAQAHSGGAVVEIVIDSVLENDKVDGILVEHNQDGTHNLGGLTAKTTPIDADSVTIIDSAASNAFKRTTWANVKATLLTWLRLSTTIIPVNAPQGHLINGKISVLDSAGITVAIKTLAGTDPSSSDPVYVRIGDTVRSITSALSVSKADGTNWFNAGSAELATKEIDYFVYLGYNATDGVTIGFARIPGANQYSDFSATTTNEKYCAISTITNAASTDYYENVGRFAATLSAGAGYTWTVPTFTAINLIQRPIYESRWNLAKSTLAGFSAITSETIAYRLIGNSLFIESVGNLGGTSNATTFTLTLPFSAGSVVGTKNLMSSNSGDAGSTLSAPSFIGITSGSTSVTVGKTMANTSGGGFTASSTKWVTLSGMVVQI